MRTPAVAPDRRPIAARDRAVFQRMAAGLVACRASPNAISVGGMLAGIGAGTCLAATPRVEPLPARVLFLLAAGLVQLRLLANMLDGMVAIGRGMASPVGELYNEVPDRISDLCTLIGLGYATGGRPELGYAAGSLAVLCAYIRSVGKSAGAGSDFRGPMAKQQRMFTMTVTCLYLALAPAGWQPRWRWGSSEAGLPCLALLIIAIGTAYTCARRLRSIARTLRERQS
jgi:phosphatidylglycerophosphate synthase